MKKLILHIGIQKTGTTAIQQFLHRNRERFEASGFGIPVQTGRYRVRSGNDVYFARNGFFLLPLVHAKTSWAASEKPGNVETARNDAERFKAVLAGHDTVVLSDEDISAWASRIEGFWPLLKQLLQDLGVERTEVIVYLRRQDGFASSWWLQRVKASDNFAPTFEDYLQGPVSLYLNYNAWISALEDVFGRDNVTVRRYERSRFPGGDIRRDFCAVVGMPWRKDFELPEADPNPSISHDVAEIKRLFNAMPGYRGSGNFLRPPAVRASGAYPDQPGMSMFSPQEAAALLARHAEGNRAIAERHFGGEPLFDEDVSKTVRWTRDDARLREVAAALFADRDTMAATILLLARELDRQRIDSQGLWVLSRCLRRLAKCLPASWKQKLKKATTI